MTDYTEVIEICKIAQVHEGPQNLSAVGIGTYLRKCSPELVLALIAENERLATSRSKKERELEQELEVWHHGPFCWTCGDTGDVHDITGEWRGECDCLSAQLINANRARDQFKAENEALRLDAERYRWLREYTIRSLPVEGALESLDRQIDSRRAKEARS